MWPVVVLPVAVPRALLIVASATTAFVGLLSVSIVRSLWLFLCWNRENSWWRRAVCSYRCLLFLLEASFFGEKHGFRWIKRWKRFLVFDDIDDVVKLLVQVVEKIHHKSYVRDCSVEVGQEIGDRFQSLTVLVYCTVANLRGAQVMIELDCSSSLLFLNWFSIRNQMSLAEPPVWKVLRNNGCVKVPYNQSLTRPSLFFHGMSSSLAGRAVPSRWPSTSNARQCVRNNSRQAS